MTSAIYVGHVVHQRLGAIEHGFRYPISMFLLDLDRVADLSARLRLFGYNRTRLVSLRDRDHFGDPAAPVSRNVRDLVRASGVEEPVARVLLLTQCRVLGYVFNPVSFFYCFDADGDVLAIVAEVHNTFGERHPYVLTRPGARGSGLGVRDSGFGVGGWEFTEKKVFHVSPFLTLDGHYRFALETPADRMTLRIDLHHEGRVRLASRLTLERRPLSDAGIGRVLLRHPLMPHRVIAGIHWHALRLWWKGARYHPRPRVPEAADKGQEVGVKRNRRESNEVITSKAALSEATAPQRVGVGPHAQ